MSSCPNKTSPEWKALVSAVGGNNAMKLFISNGDNIVDPYIGAFQLFAEANAGEAAKVLESNLSDQNKKSVTPTSTINDLISVADPAMFKSTPFLKWAEANNYKIKGAPVVGKEVKIDTIPALTPEINTMDAVKNAAVIQNTGRANEIVYKMAFKMSQQTGVDFEMIDTDSARKMLDGTLTPYGNQAGFFYNGTCYFVKDRVTLQIVFHEFSHPVVASIKINNRPLFDNLHMKVLNTIEGQELINDILQEFPDLSQDSDRFKEELIVRALEHDAVVNKRLPQSVSAQFASAVNNILFAIKQWFREVFGKIKIDKLNSNTTINELADMLANKDFQIDIEEISDEEIALFASMQKEAINNLIAKVDETKSKDKLQNMINALNAVIRKSEKEIKYQKTTKEVIGTEEGGPLKEMRSIISKASDINLTEAQKKAHENLTISQQAASLINTLATLKTVTQDINKDLLRILNTDTSKMTEKEMAEHTKLSINQADTYSRLLKYWRDTIKYFETDMDSAGITGESPVRAFLGTITFSLGQGLTTFKQIQRKGSIELIHEWTKFYREDVTKKYDNRIKELEAKLVLFPGNNTIIKELENVREEQEKFSLSKDKIDALFKGELPDASFFSSMFESYTNNADPIIGSFAVFIKNNISRIQENAVRNQMAFRKELNPLLKRAGIKPGENVKDTWKFALINDETYGYDENGKIVKREVASFLSSTIGGRWKLKEKEVAIEDAKKKVASAKGEEAIAAEKENLRVAVKALNDEKMNFWNQVYKKEVYEANSKLLDVTAVIDGKVVNVGLEAYLDQREKLALISEDTDVIFSEIEFYEKNSAIKEKWDEYFELFSLKNPDGTDKTGLELLKAQALLDHRERTKEYYKWIEKKGAFAISLKAYQDELLISEPELNDEDRRKKVQDWIMTNTRPGVTEQYKMELADVFNRLTKFNESLSPELREEMNLTDDLNTVNSLAFSYKDSFGQPDGTAIPSDKRDELNVAQQSLNDAMFDISQESVSKLTEDQLIERAEIFEEMARLRGKNPTSYYLDTINNQLTRLGQPLLDKDTAGDFLKRRGDQGIILAEEIMGDADNVKDANFRTWFMANHVKKYYTDKETGDTVFSYERLKVWTIVEPKADEYKETVEVTYANGDKETFMGRTTDFKYKTKVVKDEYRTMKFGITAKEKEALVGKVIDNKGNYLPKNKEDYYANPARDAKGNILNNTYINEAYYELKKNDPLKFQILETMVKYHINNQKGVDYKSRLYMDIPRYRLGSLRLSTAEVMEAGKTFSEEAQRIAAVGKGIAATVKGLGTKEANLASIEAGLAAPNLTEPTELGMDQIIKAITSGSDNDRLPIEGTSYMSPDDISYNVLLVLDKYALSAEKQRVFTEINPLARAILETLNPENDPKLDGIDKAILNAAATNTTGINPKENSKVRYETIKTLYEREFKGKIFSENHLDWVNKVTSKLMGAASFSYFALNLPSAIKNYWGALWQMNMEAVAGEHMDVRSYGKAKVWTEPAKANWINNIYGGDNFSLSNQMIMFFDPLQGKMEEIFGEHGTRTTKGDILSLSWLYSPRKFMEFEAGLQLFAGMMFHKQIEHIIDGKSVMMSYMDSFEQDSERELVKLKSTVKDKEYGITVEETDEDGNITTRPGEKYNQFKNLIHEKAKDLNGTFTKFEQPQAQAHFAYRLIMFMRRYFTTMFMNRFAKKRASFAKNDITQGFYVQSVLTMGKIIGSYGFYINLMSEDEKIAGKKALTEAAQILAVAGVVALIFGYDDDDPERFAKMEARSGAIGSDNFNLPGFLSNHLLLLLMKTSNENQTFLPLPGFGLNDYNKMATVTSIAFGPTLTSYGKIITDLAMHAAPGEDPHLFYQRDVGPYPWQKAESAKIWNHIASMAGMTGSDIDPIKAARSYEAVQKIK